jgi:hypothetical protein
MATIPQSVPHVGLQPQALPFGDDLAPPRQLYITFIPAVLVFVGILSWVIANESGMLLACVAGAVIAVFTLWDWIFSDAPTRLSTLMAMALLLGYGGGTLNTWMTLPRSSLDLAAYMNLPEGVLARGMGAVLISSAILFFLGEIYERPIFGREFRLHLDEKMRTLIRLGSLGMVAGYATHSLDFQGVTAAGGHVSIFGSFLLWIYSPLTSIAAASFLTARTRKDRILDGLSLLILFLVVSLTGRRVAIYTGIGILFTLRLIGFRWREDIVRKALILLGLGGVVVMCSLTFMLLRIAGSAQRKGGWISVEQRLVIAGRMVQKGGAYSLAAEVSRTNLQKRTFVLGFLSNVLDVSMHMTPALGQDAVGMIQIGIPRFIYPEKNAYFSEEALVDQHYGLSYGDEPNSILTGGATDFGLIGMILYPLITIFVFRAVFRIFEIRLPPVPLLFLILSFIQIMLITEGTIAIYFDTVRNAALFGIVLAIFVSLPKFRLRA